MGEIFFGVINDVIGTKRLHQCAMGSTAYPAHFGPKLRGKLYRIRTYRSRSAIDQDFCPRWSLATSRRNVNAVVASILLGAAFSIAANEA